MGETESWRNILNIKNASQIYPNVQASDESWSFVFWSDESCAALVRDHFPSFATVYSGFPYNIQRIDSCRYLILSKYGGVYADTDISLHSNVNTFERLIPNGVGLVESPYRYNEVWQNSLMTASQPEHPFWEIVIKIMIERAGSDFVLSSTGPRMIGNAVERFRRLNQDIVTLPCEIFQRLPVGDWETSISQIFAREVLARAIPMRGCGVYGDGKCEVTRHVGKASWTKESSF